LSVPEPAARGFGSAADVYERARPTYARDAVAWICDRLRIGPGRDVLDLAAGTGKLTRDLVPTGARLVAVEPVDEMRAALVRAVPGVKAFAGTAERIPLGDASVDAVVCAQAFHWFDADRALPEIHRVLRPGGGLGLIWNTRDVSDPIQERLDEILEPFRGVSEQHWQGDADRNVEASGLFGDVEYRQWPNEQEVTLDGLLEVAASRSYVASLDEEARRGLLAEIRAAFADEPEPIVLRYIVDVYVAAVRRASTL
jgi:SAM-dependent methyltransferase